MTKSGKRPIKPQVTVKLKSNDRKKLKQLVTKGTGKAREIKRANILLMSDKQMTPKEISESLDSNKKTIQTIKERYLTGGVDAALYDKPRSGAPKLFDGKTRAKLTALACTKAPDGHSQWTLRLLSNKAVELDFVDTISHTQMSRILKKTKSSLI